MVSVDRLEAEGVGSVQLQFTDVPGAVKSVTIPTSHLAAVLEEGLWFDGSSVEGLARVAESDLYLRPDPSTLAILPWERRPTARLICDLFQPDGTPFTADPRRALRSALDDARDLGFVYRVACELEFSIFHAPADGERALRPIDSGGYFEVTEDRAEEVCRAATGALASLGFAVEMTHHEVAPGQHEIDLAVAGALELADALVALKTALRVYGRRDGLLVSFMPKPIENKSGSGLHIQQVLVERASGRDAFFDPDHAYQLSAAGRRFVAGQLAHARAMCAVVAPLVNSYKRLMGGNEAPAHIAWARTSRGALIRVPNATAGHPTLVELRAPDPSCNPYLALAVMLRAGLDGIASELELPEPIEEPLVREPKRAEGEPIADVLPGTLAEALEALAWDPVVRDALGQPIYERFLAAKEREWAEHSAHVSEWELRTYLERA
ncbi:MAG: glutamine synthetase [Chloroflexota bacterium]|nr:glutamine synthetase [Chloroflexota bacterium]MDE3192369.1 glutamine synthetase [Chloroflexota bacterium]